MDDAKRVCKYQGVPTLGSCTLFPKQQKRRRKGAFLKYNDCRELAAEVI